LWTGELHAHKKKPSVGIVVLSGFFYIACALKQEARDAMNDAGFVFTR
jgi:hypothetical protein